MMHSFDDDDDDFDDMDVAQFDAMVENAVAETEEEDFRECDDDDDDDDEPKGRRFPERRTPSRG